MKFSEATRKTILSIVEIISDVISFSCNEKIAVAKNNKAKVKHAYMSFS
jgi:hypothetical protein